MEDTFIRNIDGSFSKAVVGSDHTVVGCTLPLNDGLSIEVGEAEPTTITETTPETSRWIGRDVYELIRAVKAILRHEMETDQPFRQPYHGLMQALVNVTGSDDLGEK